MRARELVQHLEDLIDLHGDIPVAINTQDAVWRLEYLNFVKGNKSEEYKRLQIPSFIFLEDRIELG